MDTNTGFQCNTSATRPRGRKHSSGLEPDLATAADIFCRRVRGRLGEEETAGESGSGSDCMTGSYWWESFGKGESFNSGRDMVTGGTRRGVETTRDEEQRG